ncbi:MAG TPA: MopE-related protein [Myxococcota bacterium]|nr:MopE-related protein [Myxococcota bacterium]
MRKLGWFVSSLALLALTACGSSDSNTADIAPEDTSTQPDIPPNDTSGDTGVDTTSPDADTGPVDTFQPDPGAFGAPCNDDQECDSRHCVASPDGLVCSRICFEDCPSDWSCLGKPEGNAVVFICVHDEAVLCQPCRASTDCNPEVVSGPNACVPFGDSGSFCATACERDSECPAGYACQDTAAASTKQCLPVSGECSCNSVGVQLGMSTTCRFSNEHGTCGGERACTATGLTSCEGQGAVPETCNNIDDDCDGEVDEGITPTGCEVESVNGRCAGVTSCSGGDVVCVGQLPSAEVCNGIDDDCNGTTDDGFPDTDNDGQKDCVDTDDDDDGALDVNDCAPLDGTVYPGQAESCNGKDDDCDGLVDELNALGCRAFYRDADGDGFGSSSVASRCQCGPNTVSGFVVDVGGDCDDFADTIRPEAPESCNLRDDDCDSQTDEGVQSPCGDCSPICLMTVGDRGVEGLDPEQAEEGSMVVNPDGSLSLNSTSVSIPFIWIANSPNDTVSRLDTTTGREVARYPVCSDPSRTAVDLRGDGIVACRGDGRVVKIAILESDCIDRNNNGTIETSRDLNGDGVIGSVASGERFSYGNDECVLWNVVADPNCNTAIERCGRAAGVDADNNIWAGFYGSRNLVKLDGSTGAILRTHPLTFSPYGLAIAADGVIWAASRSPMGLGKVDPESGQVGFWNMPSGRSTYGLAIDHAGRPWVATGEHQGASRFDPVSETWSNFGPWPNPGPINRGHTRGVAIKLLTNAQGTVVGSQIFLAHHDWASCSGTGHRNVTMLDASTGNVIRTLDVGAERGPVGVAVANDGMLWTVNQCGSNATRINPDNGTVLGSYATGSSPYTYSDMTGYALRTITARSGYYREVFMGWDAGSTRWRSIFVEADLPGNGQSFVRLRYRVAATEAQLANAAWSANGGPFPPLALPWTIDAVGRYIEVEVTLGTNDPAYIPTLRGVSVIGDQL